MQPPGPPVFPQGGGGYAPAAAANTPYAPVPPSATMSPPYLASRTAARQAAPFEPYRDGTRAVLLGFGAVLVLSALVPLTTQPGWAFRWDALTSDGIDGLMKFRMVYVCAAAMLALAFALAPLATVARGTLALLLGMAPLAVGVVAALRAAPGFLWQVPVGAAATVTLIPGLLLRQEYRWQKLPRVLTTLGALAVIALYVVPASGGKPLVQVLVDGITAAAGKNKVLVIVALVPLIVAALSLVCWGPATSSVGAKVLAWFAILSSVLLGYTALLVAGNLGEVIKLAPNQALLSMWTELPGDATGGGIFPVSAAWAAMIGYGLSSLLGKNLEQP